MSDKFLGYGQGSVNLTNGSATIFSATLGAAALTASKPVKTNSVKQLVSANLDIPDINNLQTQLNEKDELTFVEDDTHNNPPSGKVKIYAKTDGGIYKLDSSGNETSLGGGGGGVSTTNPPVLDNALVFYDGTDGTKIKQINGIYYDSLNSALQVDDLETSATFSLNDELQKISNITVDPLTPLITDFQGEIHVAKIKSASHNTELEFETLGSAILTSDADIQLVTGTGDIQLNGNSITLACPVNNLTYNGDNVVAIDANNVNIGVNAGNNLNTGTDNILIGLNAGVSMTDTFQNIAIGQSALSSITNEYADAVAIGDLSQQLTTGLYNVSVGKDTLRRTTTGQYNTAVGTLSTAFNTTGNNNTAIGADSLFSNTVGVDNTAVGYNCLYFNSASSNTAVGKACMYNNTTGSGNVAMGQGSLSGNQTGGDNTFIGRAAGNVGNAINQSVGIGAESLQQNTTGSTCVGYRAGQNSEGEYNTAVGWESLKGNTTGYENTAVGKQSLLTNSIGYYNTSIGLRAGIDNTTGAGNTFIGANSGGACETGNTNTFIGFLTNSAVGVNPTNSTAIGYGAFTEKSNEIALGNYDITEIRSATNGLCNLGSSANKFKDLYIAGAIYGSPYDLSFACTDEVNTITSTGQKMYLRAPRDFNVQKFKVSLNSTGGAGFALNIKKNGSNMIATITLGTTITTITPATPVSVLENDVITVEVSNIGSGTGTGLKVYLIGKT